MQALADQDLSAGRQRGQPRRGVHRLAHHRVVQAPQLLPADAAQDHLSRVQPDAQALRVRGLLPSPVGHCLELLPGRDARVQGPAQVLLAAEHHQR
jgi:hypothetical protein